MIVTAGNKVQLLSTADAWALASVLEGFGTPAHRLMGRLLRAITRTPLHELIEIRLEPGDLELVLAALTINHTEVHS